MIKLAPREQKAECKRCLVARVAYLADPDADSHEGKLIHASRNYGCRDQSEKSFLAGVDDAFELGKKRREARKVKSGNPTLRLFEEIIYSSPENSKLTSEEREVIEATLVAEFRGCYMRVAWHENPDTGIDDFHILVSARDRFGNATLSTRYGDGKQTFASRRNDLDQQFCDLINSTREVQFEPVHVLHRAKNAKRKKKPLPPLAREIAQSTKEPVTRQNLADVIIALGHTVINQLTLLADAAVKMIYMDGMKERHHRVDKLLLDIEMAQFEMEDDMGSGGTAAEPAPLEDAPAIPATPAIPVKPVPEKPAAKKTTRRKKKPTKDPKYPEIT